MFSIANLFTGIPLIKLLCGLLLQTLPAFIYTLRLVIATQYWTESVVVQATVVTIVGLLSMPSFTKEIRKICPKAVHRITWSFKWYHISIFLCSSNCLHPWVKTSENCEESLFYPEVDSGTNSADTTLRVFRLTAIRENNRRIGKEVER